MTLCIVMCPWPWHACTDEWHLGQVLETLNPPDDWPAFSASSKLHPMDIMAMRGTSIVGLCC